MTYKETLEKRLTSIGIEDEYAIEEIMELLTREYYPTIVVDFKHSNWMEELDEPTTSN